MSDLPKYNSCLGVGDTETDYRLGGAISLPMPRNTFETYHIQYDQSKVRKPNQTKMACTIFGAMGVISDLTGYIFTEDDITDIMKQAVLAGFNPVVGWWLMDAIKLVSGWYSAKYEPLYYFKVDLRKTDASNAWAKGYSIQVAYSGNGAYNLDYKDGKLDLTSFGTATYSHCIRDLNANADNLKDVDNYLKAGQVNTYLVPKINMTPLIANGVYSPYGYVVCYKKDFDSMNDPVVPLFLTKAVEFAKFMNFTEGNIDDVVANGEVEDMLIKMGIFNTKMGNVTRGRMWEAMRRIYNLNHVTT